MKLVAWACFFLLAGLQVTSGRMKKSQLRWRSRQVGQAKIAALFISDDPERDRRSILAGPPLKNRIRHQHKRASSLWEQLEEPPSTALESSSAGDINPPPHVSLRSGSVADSKEDSSPELLLKGGIFSLYKEGVATALEKGRTLNSTKELRREERRRRRRRRRKRKKKKKDKRNKKKNKKNKRKRRCKKRRGKRRCKNGNRSRNETINKLTEEVANSTVEILLFNMTGSEACQYIFLKDCFEEENLDAIEPKEISLEKKCELRKNFLNCVEKRRRETPCLPTTSARGNMSHLRNSIRDAIITKNSCILNEVLTG